MMYLFYLTSITEKAWNAIRKYKNHWEREGGVYGPTFICYLYNASKGMKSAIFNIIGKMNIFRSEHEGHDIMKIVTLILRAKYIHFSDDVEDCALYYF